MRVLFFLLILAVCSIVNAQEYVYVFGADWCGYCVKMDREVWSNQEVKSALVGYYGSQTWHFDSDNKSETEQKYFRYYNVTALPTTIIVREDGTLVKKHVGYMDKKATLKFLGAKNDNKENSSIHKE